MTISEWRFILVFVAVLLSQPVLNFVVDPYELRNQDPALLRSNPPNTFSRAARMLRFEATAAQLDERAVILGTSHIGVGIDSCEAGMAKLWLNGMRRDEIIRLVTQLAKSTSGKRLIIIDIAALARGPTSENHLSPFLNSLLNPNTTLDSLRKLLGVRKEPTSLACQALPNPTATGDLNMPNAWKILLSNKVIEFESGITEVAAACRNPNVRIAVVWFPFHFTPNTSKQIGSLVDYLDGSRAISFPVTEGGCQLNVINLASQEFQAQSNAGKLGEDTENWFDFNHFRPAAGSGYIDSVLRRMDYQPSN